MGIPSKIYWLVVWNMFYFPPIRLGMMIQSDFFFRGVGQPPTSICIVYNNPSCTGEITETS